MCTKLTVTPAGYRRIRLKVVVRGKIQRLFALCPWIYSLKHMNKIHNAPQGDIPTVTENFSLRNWIKQLFSGRIKGQSCSCADGFGQILEKLEEVKESIDIIAREIHRQAEKRKGESDAR
jgi:hypothetical protein